MAMCGAASHLWTRIFSAEVIKNNDLSFRTDMIQGEDIVFIAEYLMLCDSIEAAARTLKDNSPETFSEFVENIVEGKIIIGQLDEADVSIRQLNTIKEVLKGYLSQIYHERVVYPNRTN